MTLLREPSSEVLLPIGSNNLEGELARAARLLGVHHGGPRAGPFAYAGFDWVNQTFFDGKLPTPLILWSITPYGKCLGFTRADAVDPTPIVCLHPAVWAPVTEDPWRVPTRWLGGRFALDVLLHECVHLAVA